MYLYFTIALALLPVVVLLVYTYRKDRFEKEPISLLTLSFIAGIFSVVIALIFNALLPEITFTNYISQAAYDAGVSAAICEEVPKFLLLYLLIWKNKNFNEYYDGIIYSVFIGLGFAAAENIGYHLTYGNTITIGRALLAVPAHFLFAISMGYFFSMAKFFPSKRKKYLLLSLTNSIVLHFLYDFILMINTPEIPYSYSTIFTLIFYTFDAFLWIYGIKRIKTLTKLDEK
jgi:protease PrsW